MVGGCRNGKRKAGGGNPVAAQPRQIGSRRPTPRRVHDRHRGRGAGMRPVFSSLERNELARIGRLDAESEWVNRRAK